MQYLKTGPMRKKYVPFRSERKKVETEKQFTQDKAVVPMQNQAIINLWAKLFVANIIETVTKSKDPI